MRCAFAVLVKGAAQILMLLGILAGCSGEPSTASWRDPSRPIASKALFLQESFAGDWQIVQAWPAADQGGQLRYRFDGGRVEEILRSAEGGELRRQGQMPRAARFRFQDTYRWVLWVAADGCTAVMGNPAGDFAWILSRSAHISADHLAAAREILDFNGYTILDTKETR